MAKGGNDYKDGWGVVDVDGLDVKSVSDTRRAAIVNWLVTRANTHVNITHSTDDIEKMWNGLCGDAMVRPVRIYVQ